MFVAGWRHALRSEWPFIIIIIISDELEVRARGRHVLLLGNLNARVGTLVDTAPDDLLTGLEHLTLPFLGPTHEAAVITTRNNADKGVNPFGRAN